MGSNPTLSVVLENNWVASQSGFAIVLWSVNQDGNAPWSVTQDVTFRYNVLRNTASAINLAGKGGSASIPARRISIAHNVIVGVGGVALGGGGRIIQMLGGVNDVYIANNTGFGKEHTVPFDGASQTGFGLVDNAFGQTAYGVYGGGAAEGTTALAKFAPGAVVTGIAFVGARAWIYPGGNLFPASAGDIGLAGLVAGEFRIGSTSPLGPIVGGQQSGADLSAVAALTIGVAP